MKIIGEVEISGKTFVLFEGMGKTMDQAHGLSRRDGYELQKAWYDATGIPEPIRVRVRRLAAHTNPAVQEPKRVAKPSSYSAAELIRKGIAEGLETKAIITMVKQFGLPCRSRDVAYYRYQIKRGK